MTPEMRAVIAALAGKRFPLEDEKATQAAIGDTLCAAGLHVEREVRVAGGVIDFLVGWFNDKVGVEVKLKGQPEAIRRQLRAYANEPQIAGLVLVTAKPVGVVQLTAGKPVAEFDLGEGLAMMLPKFTAADANKAYDEWGCNCGPGALAAMCGLTLDQVRPLIPDFDTKRYTNPSMMNAALRAAGVAFTKIGRAWPIRGLVRVQWEGPWTEPGVPMVARYRYTHWIGAARCGDGIFDINAIGNGTGWCSRADWEAHIVPHITANYKRATGAWHVTHALEVLL